MLARDAPGQVEWGCAGMTVLGRCGASVGRVRVIPGRKHVFQTEWPCVCVLWESAVTGCVCQGVFKLQRLKSVNQLCSRVHVGAAPLGAGTSPPSRPCCRCGGSGCRGYPPLCGSSSWPFPVLSGSLLSHDTHFLKEAAVCGPPSKTCCSGSGRATCSVLSPVPPWAAP